MIIRYNPPAGAHTRTYRQELRRSLRPLGAGITLFLDTKVKPGGLTVVCGVPPRNNDTPEFVAQYERMKASEIAEVKRVTRLTNVEWWGG